MIHQFRDKKSINKRKKTIRTAIGFGVFLLLAVTGVLAWSAGLLSTIGRPVWQAQQAIVDTAHDASVLVRTKSSVFRDNDRLLGENAELNNSMIDYQVLKSENDQLRELLGRIPETSKFTLATILAKPNRSPYDTIIIDIGSNSGVEIGQRVYANASIPLGQISKVNDKTSLVMLYSNPGQKTEVILDGSNASVELVGRGGGNFEMIIPLELSANKGWAVLLPNTSTEVIAIIEEIISTPTDPIKKVLLRSPINIQSIKWVQVKSK
jgi:cell shape-determining protein MreC